MRLDETRPTREVTGLVAELVGDPVHAIPASFENDLIASCRHHGEEPVVVDRSKRPCDLMKDLEWPEPGRRFPEGPNEGDEARREKQHAAGFAPPPPPAAPPPRPFRGAPAPRGGPRAPRRDVGTRRPRLTRRPPVRPLSQSPRPHAVVQ